MNVGVATWRSRIRRTPCSHNIEIGDLNERRYLGA